MKSKDAFVFQKFLEVFIMKNVKSTKLWEDLKGSVIRLFIISSLFTILIPAYASAGIVNNLKIDSRYSYEIRPNNATTKGLHVDGKYGGLGKGNVQLWDNGIRTTNKLWKFKAYGNIKNGVYLIYSMRWTNKVLEVANSSTNNGANVQISDRSDITTYSKNVNGVLIPKKVQNPHQLWHVYYLNGKLFLKNRGSGKYLDVSGSGTGNGTNIHQWNYHGRANQQFKLLR
jgi:hypothetical protein